MDIKTYLEGSEEVKEYVCEDHCDICGFGLTTKEFDEQTDSNRKICDSCTLKQKSAGK